VKRKPTSYGDMLKSVQTIQHPDLKQPHRNLLLAIAVWCGQTGESSRPTHEYFQQALGVGRTRVKDILAEVIALGFAVCTHRGRGKGDASVYRICLEHPAFTDTYKGHHVVALSNQVTATAEPVNGHPKPTLGPPEGELRATTGCPPSFDLSSTPSTHTPTPTETAKASGVCVHINPTPKPAAMISQKPLTEAEIETEINKAIEYASLIEREPVTPTTPQRLKMKELLRDHGSEAYCAAVKAFCKDHPWNAQTYPQNRWSGLVNGFAGYAAMKTLEQNDVKRKKQQEADFAATDLWHAAILVLDRRYQDDLAAGFLTEDEKAHIELVRAATCARDLPPDSDKKAYALYARWVIWEQSERERRDAESEASGFL
jgi:hypothetical protein